MYQALRYFSPALLLLLAGCHETEKYVAPPLPAVTVALPLEREVTDFEEFTGDTEAVEKVEIRARVSGYLVKVNFKDGQIVQQGDLLYEIDPRPFQAALDEANGALERLQAEKKLMDIQVERYRTLAKQSAASQQDVDRYLAQQAENVGAIKAAQAAVEKAKLNLGFTKITAPIAGQLSRTFLTVGNLVNADVTVLTTLVSLDPIYAYFNVEEPTMLELRKMVREGAISTIEDKDIPVRMGLADDVKREFPIRGVLDFSNNAVNKQTGTILVRGKFANPYHLPEKPPLLLPGLFARVRVDEGRPHKTLLVTERAIGTDQGDKYVYVVDDKNVVRYQRVKLGMVFDGLQAIESGLKAGDRVIVNGLQRVRPNDKVKVDQVKMEDAEKPLN